MPTTKKLIATASIGVVASLGLSACGGPAKISHAQFVAKANNVCMGGEATIGNAVAPDASDPSTIVSDGTVAINAAELNLEGLRKIGSKYALPAQDKAAFEKYLNLEAKQIAAAKVVLADARNNADETTITDAAAKMNAFAPDLNTAEGKLGLNECSGFEWATALDANSGLGFGP